MNVLVLGSGGREHALTWKIAQSPNCDRLYIAPGNPGTEDWGENVALKLTDFEAIATLIETEEIHCVVVGPEDPLVNGITDFLRERFGKDLIIVGPSKEGATLEGSKDYAKAFMARHNIPTARYKTFTAATLEDGFAFLDSLQPPYVLKADGLAAGKGVLIIHDVAEAKIELKNMLVDAKFGQASAQVVIEEFLSGIEFSVFALTDGKNYVLLPEAKDYKRIGDGDSGLNTGGMGAISPVPFVDAAMWQKVEERIVKPTINGLAKENISYQGFVFFGLINVGGNPMVIEYNVRLGDPETEAVLPRITSDLLALFEKMHAQKLNEAKLEISAEIATTVMVVSGGYPGDYEKGLEISGLENVADALVFHAGTAAKGDKIVTNGGRVMAFTGLAATKEKALQQSYSAINKICFNGIYYRKDIGLDV
jgi:phosphoribosylamine--glycine ligase